MGGGKRRSSMGGRGRRESSSNLAVFDPQNGAQKLIPVFDVDFDAQIHARGTRLS